MQVKIKNISESFVVKRRREKRLKIEFPENETIDGNKKGEKNKRGVDKSSEINKDIPGNS